MSLERTHIWTAQKNFLKSFLSISMVYKFLYTTDIPSCFYVDSDWLHWSSLGNRTHWIGHIFIFGILMRNMWRRWWWEDDRGKVTLFSQYFVKSWNISGGNGRKKMMNCFASDLWLVRWYKSKWSHERRNSTCLVTI